MVRSTPDSGGPAPVPSRPLTGLRVLGITPTPTHPATAGNRVRCGALFDRLQALGATVRVLHIAHEPGDEAAMTAHWNGGASQIPFRQRPSRHHRWNRFAEICRRRLGLPLRDRTDVDDWYDPATAAPVMAEVASFAPHAVLMVYYWNSAMLRSLPPQVLRVLDAQDVFTDRDERMRRAGVAQSWFSVSAAQEARGLSRFDVVLAIQEQEARHYRTISDREVVTVGHLLPLLETGAPPADPRLLIVASDNAVNVDGVRWFIEAVWPAIHAARPDAALEIVGRVCSALASYAERPGIVLTGPMPDLAPAYARARLVINPLRGGTGLKIKAAEALAAGRVVVSTPSAAEGLEAAVGRGLVVVQGDAPMAQQVLSLLTDDATLDALSAQARQFAEAWNAEQSRSFDAVFSRVWPAPSVA